MNQATSFVVSEFTNPSGEIVCRVAGWLDGKRVRRNFATRAEGEAERQVLEVQRLQTETGIRTAATRLEDAHQGTGESEQLVLSFANHEVVLAGARLALLLPEIASFHLDCLRDMPAKFRSQADKDEPFISRVSVRSVSDLPETGGRIS